MIIDIHTHTFPDAMAHRAVVHLSRTSHTLAFSDGTIDGLIETADAAGIDLSLILPVASASRQVEHINDHAAEVNRKYKGQKVFSAAAMHPDYADYKKELRRIREMGLKGIKVHPVYQDADLDDDRYLRIFDTAADLGLFVITHGGLDIGYVDARRASPAMCRHVLSAVPHLTLVMAHMGGWLNWDHVADELADTTALIDTAFSTGWACPSDDYWKDGFAPLEPGGLWSKDVQMLTAEQFMDLYRAFGAGRILFGTDSPWSRQKDVVSFMRALPIDTDDLARIMGGNAQRLLQI